MPLNWSELGVSKTMFFSKTYCVDLYTDGLENLKCMFEKHLMPTPPRPTHLVMQVWHKALPGWTPVSQIHEKVHLKRLQKNLKKCC